MPDNAAKIANESCPTKESAKITERRIRRLCERYKGYGRAKGIQDSAKTIEETYCDSSEIRQIASRVRSLLRR